jgi:hypothetical protein
MITISAAAAAALTRSWTMHTRVDAWLGAQLLATDIPVVGGAHETDRTLRIPDRVTLRVPRLDRGVSWDPGAAADHPLAPWGQRMRASIGVGLDHGQIEWVGRGWFLITDASVDGDLINVTAASLLQLIDEARLTAPLQPSGTIGAALRTLAEPALTVDLAAAPTDRAVPSGMAWDEDRLGAVTELLDAWPAEAVVSDTGALVVTAPPSDTADPVLDLSDIPGGIQIAAGGGLSRDGAATVVVARGTTADGQAVQGIAADASGGPLDAAGAFNPLPVPYFFQSPLLTTPEQCQAAAASILARRQRQASRLFEVEAVPHPALQAGDTVTIDAGTGVVERLTMPLTPADGPMRVGVRIRG